MSSAVSEMEEESRKLDECVEGVPCVYEVTEGAGGLGVSCVAEDVDIALYVSVDDNISVDASSLSSSTMGVGGAGVLQDAKGSNARISYVGTVLGSSLHFREGSEGGFEGVKDGNARVDGVCIEIVSRDGSDSASRYADGMVGGVLTDSSGWVAVANESNGCLDRYVDVGYVEESGASHFVESGVGEGSSVLRVAEGGVEGVKDVNVCADGVGGGNVMQSARVSWGSGICGVSQGTECDCCDYKIGVAVVNGRSDDLGRCDLPLPLSLQENFRLPVITDLGSRSANQQFLIRLSLASENSRYVVNSIEGQDGSMCLLVALKGEDAQRLLQGKSLCCCIVKCLLVRVFVSTT